jgi:hypothetical protein
MQCAQRPLSETQWNQRRFFWNFGSAWNEIARVEFETAKNVGDPQCGDRFLFWW